jgi:cation:H+ antiporter
LNDFITQISAYIEQFKNIEALQVAIIWVITPGWLQLLLCFIFCSFLMIIRLNAVEKNGFEGTLIGTLVMPYFSGFPNLCFAFVLAKTGSDGAVVLENCLVNNVTNLTIILAIPAILWGLNLYKTGKDSKGDTKINHLSLLLSILALIFFTAAVWLVSKDGVIGRTEGFMLIGVFLFWQLFHIFDVLKNNTRNGRRMKKRIIFDFAIIGVCAWGIFSSTDGLVQWISSNDKGFFTKSNLGLLSGILMVVPNAFLALYYAAIKRSEIAYSSQIGNCHICIPLCVGVFAVFSPIKVLPSFEIAIYIIMAASAGHFLFTAFIGKLPRFAGIILTCLYGFFIYKEII